MYQPNHRAVITKRESLGWTQGWRRFTLLRLSWQSSSTSHFPPYSILFAILQPSYTLHHRPWVIGGFWRLFLLPHPEFPYSVSPVLYWAHYSAIIHPLTTAMSVYLCFCCFTPLLYYLHFFFFSLISEFSLVSSFQSLYSGTRTCKMNHNTIIFPLFLMGNFWGLYVLFGINPVVD